MLTVLMMIGFAGPALDSNSVQFGPVAHPAVVVVSATGIGYPPRHMRGAQARLMARRAAEVVAMKNLATRLGIPAGAPLGPFRYVSTRDLSGGAVEVTVEATTSSTAPRPTPSRRP